MVAVNRIAIALALLPGLALAEVPAPPVSPPQVAALQQTVIELTGQKLDWQAQAIALQRQVDDLTKQLADAKKQAEAPK